ncbi:hypothetical protein F5B17DRAFT_427641 [Nemania serpens]|nr:hypothetical protein F5B17DRAFT_427641 [Nemania serpens]
MSDKDIPVSPAGDGESKLTAGDIKFFTAMFKYLPKNIEMDWDEFAQEMGFKDGRIAKVRCRQIRLKLGLVTPDTPTKATTANALKPANEGNKVTKAGRKPKAKQPKFELKVADGDEDDDDKAKVKVAADEGNKVTKAGRKPKAKQPKLEPKVIDDDDEAKVKVAPDADADEDKA